MNNIGNSYLTDKKLGDSERIYREAIRRFPDSYGALYGLARVQQEQGKHREAIAGMEQAIAMVARAGAWYRIGKSQQALGDKAKAAAAYDKALSFKPALPKNLKSDAEDQLKAVKK
jgi:tetratricopeptide (TPR) repeat protein